jgi:hypothetical protein
MLSGRHISKSLQGLSVFLRCRWKPQKNMSRSMIGIRDSLLQIDGGLRYRPSRTFVTKAPSFASQWRGEYNVA